MSEFEVKIKPKSMILGNAIIAVLSNLGSFDKFIPMEQQLVIRVIYGSKVVDIEMQSIDEFIPQLKEVGKTFLAISEELEKYKQYIEKIRNEDIGDNGDSVG